MSEFNHFTNLSSEWWDPNGKFKILHTLTPIRIGYIKKVIFDISPVVKLTSNKSLNNIKILDLGCGGGLVSEPLARLGADVTGVDFVKENIFIAKKHSIDSKLKIKYFHKDIRNISLKEKYDVIIMFEILEHLEDWKKIVINILKYLKPKGKIIFSTINRTFLAKIFALFIAEKILKWVPNDTHNYEKFIQPRELSKYLKANKLTVIDTTGLVFKPISNEWVLDKKRFRINYFCSAKNF